MVHPLRPTPFLRADIRLAKVPRVPAWATVDNLHYDTLPRAARNLGAANAAGVGYSVASTAVAGRALRRGVGVDGDLAIALGAVDGAGAEAAGDVGGEVAGGGAVGAWGAWRRDGQGG